MEVYKIPNRFPNTKPGICEAIFRIIIFLKLPYEMILCRIYLSKIITRWIFVTVQKENVYSKGDGWFTRFHTENPTVRYPTANQLKEFASDSFTVKQWCLERDRYTLEQKLERFPTTTKGVFIIECEDLNIRANSVRGFQVMVNIFSSTFIELSLSGTACINLRLLSLNN